MPRDLIVHSHKPLNAEPPLALLRAAFTTPQSRFYVRCHGAIPELDAARHRLRVGGLVGAPLDLSVADLRSRFAPRTVAAVLQCAGNRRADLQQVAPTIGDAWQGGAIGHADWTGVALRDVLLAAGASAGPGPHVVLSGEDTLDVKGAPVRYEVSVVLERAMDGDVLLAWAMNGEALAPEHGHPLRAVVPGYAGVRSAKWLSAVTVQDAPAASPVQQHDYKLLPPHMTEADAEQDANWLPGVPTNEMPLNAVICEPEPGARLSAGRLPVRGYAVASGRQVVRVDVSCDGGRHWVQAALEQGSGRWDWVFWSATLDLRPGGHDLAVRAWDSAGQTMPALPDDGADRLCPRRHPAGAAGRRRRHAGRPHHRAAFDLRRAADRRRGAAAAADAGPRAGGRAAAYSVRTASRARQGPPAAARNRASPASGTKPRPRSTASPG